MRRLICRTPAWRCSICGAYLPDGTTLALVSAAATAGSFLIHSVGQPAHRLTGSPAHRLSHAVREQDFLVRIPPGARALDLTFAVYKPRSVTFLAKPG